MYTDGFDCPAWRGWRRRPAALGLVASIVLLSACRDASDREADHSAASLSLDELTEATLQWRAGRLERLTAEYGWLSPIGLHVLDPGATVRVGAAQDNDLVVPRGPDDWGTVAVDRHGREATFVAADGAAVRIDGQVLESAPLRLGDAGEPTYVEAAGIRINLIDPGGRLALRVRDPQAESRLQFVGLEYFPIRPEWRVEAEFSPHPAGKTLPVANVLGQIVDEPNPGSVRFMHNGRPITLEAVAEGDRLLLLFADRTSGRETYGLGRILYSDWPVDGKVVLDFNQAFNPPCAFNAYTSCSLPPQANRIDAWIRAGEQTYLGKTGITSPIPPPSAH